MDEVTNEDTWPEIPGTWLPQDGYRIPAKHVTEMPLIPPVYFDESLQSWFACCIDGHPSREQAEAARDAMRRGANILRLIELGLLKPEASP